VAIAVRNLSHTRRCQSGSDAMVLLAGGGGYVAVRAILAAILIAAAVLKGYQLATGPVVGSGVFSPRVVLIVLVEFERLFAGWLLRVCGRGGPRWRLWRCSATLHACRSPRTSPEGTSAVGSAVSWLSFLGLCWLLMSKRWPHCFDGFALANVWSEPTTGRGSFGSLHFVQIKCDFP
jgi:hypothetical protein